MSENIYAFQKSAGNEYTFISVGRKGAIKKVVTFEEMEPGIYNVLLQDEINGLRSGDRAITDNGDALKVINTTAAIIRTVLGKPPITAIHIAGSSEQRNRTYQRRIVREWKNFIVLGQKEDEEPFELVNDKESYIAFLILFKEL